MTVEHVLILIKASEAQRGLIEFLRHNDGDSPMEFDELRDKVDRLKYTIVQFEQIVSELKSTELP